MSGYAFIDAVSEAIAHACDELDPEAFRYRGSDLRAAAERMLFVRLVNHPGVVAALAGGDLPPLESPLEAGAARALVGAEVASKRPASRLRTVASGLRRPAGVELPSLR